MKIICTHIPKSKIAFQHLTIGRSYLLVEVSAGSYRVLNDRNEPVLYPKTWFEQVDDGSLNWKTTTYEDHEYFISPEELSKRYFFEEWFDNEPNAQRALAEYVRSMQPLGDKS